jgi:hypothetical protein
MIRFLRVNLFLFALSTVFSLKWPVRLPSYSSPLLVQNAGSSTLAWDRPGRGDYQLRLRFSGSQLPGAVRTNFLDWRIATKEAWAAEVCVSEGNRILLVTNRLWFGDRSQSGHVHWLGSETIRVMGGIPLTLRVSPRGSMPFGIQDASLELRLDPQIALKDSITLLVRQGWFVVSLAAWILIALHYVRPSARPAKAAGHTPAGITDRK